MVAITRSRVNKFFESVLEKRVRIMAKQYGLHVVIGGNACYTDGKTIYLPAMEDVEEEVLADLDGMCDHELAHCLYTDFEAWFKKIHSRYLKELVNSIEDSRIELLLPKKYPGCKLSLDRLNHKWGVKYNARRRLKNENGEYVMPWPIRLNACMRELYDGKVPQSDEIIDPILVKIATDVIALRTITNTSDLIDACELIRQKINKIREDMFDDSYSLDDDELEEAMKALGNSFGATEPPVALDPNRKNKKSKQAQGNEMFDPATESAEGGEGGEEGEDSQDGESGEQSSGAPQNGKQASLSAETEGTEQGGKGEGSSESSKECQGSSQQQQIGSDEETASGSDFTQPVRGNLQQEKSKLEKSAKAFKDAETDTEQDMLKNTVDEKSEFDNHEYSSESYINKTLQETFEKQVQERKELENKKYKHAYDDEPDRIDSKMTSLPFTTQYDVVTDYTGKGDRSKYSQEKSRVMPMVNGIRNGLERALVVKENRRVKFERERGALNTRALAQIATDRNYRTPFKDFTKTDTKNVVVQLVIDLSGSMAGDKVATAILVGLAMAETLQTMGIAFECVGFNTLSSSEMSREVNKLSADERRRFTRTGTKLNLSVFKSFDSNNLSGIVCARTDGANNDGESLIWAGKRIALRPEARKIMIVLSDGQPACEGDGWFHAGNLKRVVKLLTQAGIEPVGVGIKCDSPKNFYPNWLRVDSLETLPATVVGKLAKMLIETEKRTSR